MPFISQDSSATNQAIGFRNRIINGNMRIDQRNVGAAVSVPSGAQTYITDRFGSYNGFANSVTSQQVVLGASGAPPKIPTSTNGNHTNALLWTNSATATSNTSIFAYIQTVLEANTCIDFGWGNSVPRTVTVSFWVYVSVSGVYSFDIICPGNSATYVSTYTVTTANNWQYIRITIPGPVIGTWTTDTSAFCILNWFLHGSTSANATSALNTWINSATVAYMSTTQTNIGTVASSTFAITGVQLELGSVATQFEWRPWETEMRMCQRYYEKSWDYGTAIGTNTNTGILFSTPYGSGSMAGFQYKVEKRSAVNPVTVAANGSLSTVNLVGNTTPVSVSYVNMGTKGVAILNGSLAPGSFYFWQYYVNADF